MLAVTYVKDIVTVHDKILAPFLPWFMGRNEHYCIKVMVPFLGCHCTHRPHALCAYREPRELKFDEDQILAG
jgi:hypothetical protein